MDISPDKTVIFSLVDGTVLASWQGNSTSVELGSHDAVIYMMRDFIAQGEFADRLTRLAGSND